jgi:hypothetical protein
MHAKTCVNIEDTLNERRQTQKTIKSKISKFMRIESRSVLARGVEDGGVGTY